MSYTRKQKKLIQESLEATYDNPEAALDAVTDLAYDLAKSRLAWVTVWRDPFEDDAVKATTHPTQGDAIKQAESLTLQGMMTQVVQVDSP